MDMNKEIEAAIQKEALTIAARSASSAARAKAKKLASKMIREFVMTTKFYKNLKIAVQSSIVSALKENYLEEFLSKNFYSKFIEGRILEAFK
jgi:hypothetical protein